MKRETAKLIFVISTILYGAAVIILSINQLKGAFVFLSIAWVIVYLFLLRYLRCPHCGALPHKGSFFAPYCSRCGKSLD